jgi:3-oxoacyl-(acyl-carrier-protein) synthase
MLRHMGQGHPLEVGLATRQYSVQESDTEGDIDPIEAAAIADAFKGHISPEDPLYVGSVKSNIGHLEGASGVAGIVKSVLMLERGIIPGIAGLEVLNKTIEQKQKCLKVCLAQPIFQALRLRHRRSQSFRMNRVYGQ